MRRQTMTDHREFLKRITKTLSYGQLPAVPCLSLPVTEVACAAWSLPQRGVSVRRLRAAEAADVSRSGLAAPGSLVLALLYLERLRAGPGAAHAAREDPAALFLAALLVADKFLQDERPEGEGAAGAARALGLPDRELKRAELDFLRAIEWRVHVDRRDFERGLTRLERRVALNRATERGFFTYSELGAAAGGAAELLRAAALCGALLAGYVAAVLALLALGPRAHTQSTTSYDLLNTHHPLSAHSLLNEHAPLTAHPPINAQAPLTAHPSRTAHIPLNIHAPFTTHPPLKTHTLFIAHPLLTTYSPLPTHAPLVHPVKLNLCEPSPESELYLRQWLNLSGLNALLAMTMNF